MSHSLWVIIENMSHLDSRIRPSFEKCYFKNFFWSLIIPFGFVWARSKPNHVTMSHRLWVIILMKRYKPFGPQVGNFWNLWKFRKIGFRARQVSLSRRLGLGRRERVFIKKCSACDKRIIPFSSSPQNRKRTKSATRTQMLNWYNYDKIKNPFFLV